jgi:hypothetical protein
MFYGHFSCSELIGMDSILILFWTGFTGFSGLFVIVHRRDRGLRPIGPTLGPTPRRETAEKTKYLSCRLRQKLQKNIIYPDRSTN